MFRCLDTITPLENNLSNTIVEKEKKGKNCQFKKRDDFLLLFKSFTSEKTLNAQSSSEVYFIKVYFN